MPKQYQESIVKNFFTDKEFKEFNEKYQNVAGVGNYLTPATSKEKKVLDLYLKQKISLGKAMKVLNTPQGSIGNKIRTIALKILAEKYKSLRRRKIEKMIKKIKKL